MPEHVLNFSLCIYNKLPLQKRHRNDNQVNNRLSFVLRDGEIVEEKWHKVVVGDIIKMENNQFVAVSIEKLNVTLLKF